MPDTMMLLDRDAFCARFKAEMLRLAPFSHFADGGTVADYADEVAPSYFEDQHQDGETPEECAEADISYWCDG